MEPARDRHSPARRAVCLRQRALECSRREREGSPRYLDELPAAWRPGGVAVALVHESLLTCPGRENRLARLGVAIAIARNRTENCKIVRLHGARPAVRLEKRLHSVA